MALETVPIRAKISFGNLTVETPFILSFNIKKERNNKSTFSASLKVLSTDLNNLGGSTVVISAGIVTNQHKIFTGYILQSNPSPCWEDPKYVILNISGADVLHRLEHEKYTRLQTSAKSKWAAITGVSRKAKKGSQFKLVNHEILNTTDGESVLDDANKDKVTTSVLDELGQPLNNDGGSITSIKFSAVVAIT